MKVDCKEINCTNHNRNLTHLQSIKEKTSCWELIQNSSHRIRLIINIQAHLKSIKQILVQTKYIENSNIAPIEIKQENHDCTAESPTGVQYLFLLCHPVFLEIQIREIKRVEEENQEH
jgi:hypothetical protein